MFKGLHLWLPAWLRRRRGRWDAARQTHLVFCVCDHFEPFHAATREEALERVTRWEEDYPEIARRTPDSNGHPLCHTFFYPIEQYDPEVLERMAGLCRETECEVEVHLHHKDDTAEGLAAALREGVGRLASHGLLSSDAGGAVRFGFIHGNWALDNSHPQGKHCGVRNELRVLREAGCYADFTMPSAPDLTQTGTINSIYYATPTDRPKSHNHGRPATAGVMQAEGLLLVQGPLGLNLRRRKWGLLPRIENGDLTPRNPPSLSRLRLWLDINVHVAGREEWIFAKLHTHGGTPPNMRMLLGEQAENFHRCLAESAKENTLFHYHYATARELVNMVHAAEAGHTGNPGEFRNFRYTSRLKAAAPL